MSLHPLSVAALRNRLFDVENLLAGSIPRPARLAQSSNSWKQPSNTGGREASLKLLGVGDKKK
jgi:hypothetical protein